MMDSVLMRHLKLVSILVGDDGGVDSERTFVRQLVQKFMNDGSDENLFNEEEESTMVSKVG